MYKNKANFIKKLILFLSIFYALNYYEKIETIYITNDFYSEIIKKGFENLENDNYFKLPKAIKNLILKHKDFLIKIAHKKLIQELIIYFYEDYNTFIPKESQLEIQKILTAGFNIKEEKDLTKTETQIN